MHDLANYKLDALNMLFFSQLQAYAHQQSASGILVDSMYMGRAVEGDNVKFSDDALHGTVNTSLIAAAYWIPPFIVLLIIVIAVLTVPCISFEWGFMEKQVKENPTLQSNIVAALTTFSLITLYIIVMDGMVLRKECDRDSLPSYYPNKPYSLFGSTITFFLFSISLLISGIVIMIVFLCIKLSSNECCLTTEEIERDRCDNDVSFCESVLFVASIVLIFGSTAFSLMFHLPTVIMAWITDPLYASKVAIFYEFIFVLYFYTFHYIYTLLYNWNLKADDKSDKTHRQRAGQAGNVGNCCADFLWEFHSTALLKPRREKNDDAHKERFHAVFVIVFAIVSF